MDLYQKISILGPAAQYDTCGPRDFGQTTKIPGVYHAKVAGNHVCRLFKVLQTNACHNNCLYCAFRRDRSCQRTITSPDEMAKAFDSAHSRKLVDGLFLSSGLVNSPDQTMGKMLDTVTILRKKYQYRGYVHLKIMPGSSNGSIQEAIKLSNRLSLNIESATEQSLAELAPDKKLRSDIYRSLSLIKEEIKKLRYAGKRAASLTSQFVVGAASENDKDIIRNTHFLYKNFGLSRVFYSAFRPIKDTPLAGRKATSLTRQHRLYQADFLMRFYRFRPYDIPLNKEGLLSELTDPKMLWAKNHPQFFPVNLNKADYWTLLRVPGIGPVAAKKIIQRRRQSRIKNLSQMTGQRLQLEKLKAFVCF
ncbi:MAG: radical SAM protein [Candidatus Woesebacteria bacterium]|jgi:predicted DNA-binding helix-hairpin-helix protein